MNFLGHAEFPYPADVRRRILLSMNSPRASVADLARLNFLLGELYAEAVIAAQKKLRIKAELVGCHGQTLYHQGVAALFWDASWRSPGKLARARWSRRAPACRWFRIFVRQTWRPAAKARRWFPTSIICSIATRKIGRIALNLGGIANLSAIPAAAT